MDRQPSPAQRTAYGVLAAALCLAALVAIVLLISEESGDFAEDVGFTVSALLIHGLAIAAGIAVADRPGLRWLGLICIAVGLVGFGFTASLGWAGGSTNDPALWLLKTAGSLTVFSLALAQVAILLARRSPVDRRLVDTSIGLTAIGALGVAALLTVAIVGEVGDDYFYRWVAVAAVVWILGAGLVPIGRKLQREPR